MTAGNLSRLSLAIASGLACFALLSGTADALEKFPGELQQAAGLSCAPACILCHQTNQGGSGTATKRFAAKFLAAGGYGDVAAGWQKMVTSTDPDTQSLVTAALAGIDADTGGNLCGVTYGCGARIAKDEPQSDWSGIWFAAVAMGFGATLRRTRRR